MRARCVGGNTRWGARGENGAHLGQGNETYAALLQAAGECPDSFRADWSELTRVGRRLACDGCRETRQGVRITCHYLPGIHARRFEVRQMHRSPSGDAQRLRRAQRT